MVRIHTLNIEPAVVNSSCAWASDYEELRDLYDSPYTGAVITRTATFNGFSEDASNTVALAKSTVSSINSYGYSPHPLSKYLEWIYTILTTPMLDGSPPTKPVIISITASTPTVLTEMVENIQTLRKKLRASNQTPTAFVPDPATLVGIELNTSCPNIKDAPPPSYNFQFLLPHLDVLSSAFYADSTLTIGLKLPPYLYQTRFVEVVRFLHTYTREHVSRFLNPFAYLACTNTLGNCLLFAEDPLTNPSGTSADPERPSADSMETDDTPPPHPPSPSTTPSLFALPTPLGGLGGDALHPIALGNVYSFARLLAAHPDPAMRRIRIIGIGGVTSAAAAARMRQAGASVVGCATLLGREGVRAFEIL
ncbi:FMN-linked oxidoreductase, partial [Dichomitus squalens LYAD-421 SS1]